MINKMVDDARQMFEAEYRAYRCLRNTCPWLVTCVDASGREYETFTKVPERVAGRRAHQVYRSEHIGSLPSYWAHCQWVEGREIHEFTITGLTWPDLLEVMREEDVLSAGYKDRFIDMKNLPKV